MFTNLELSDDIELYKLTLANNFNIIKKSPNNVILSFIENYIFKLKYDNNYKYKYTNRLPHLIQLSKLLHFVKIDEKDINTYTTIFELLRLISICMYGQKILYTLESIMNKLSNNFINSLIIRIAPGWTLPVYLYYMNLIKNKDINVIEVCITGAFSNSDDRIYKYIFDSSIKDKINFTPELIESCISSIGSPHIPSKYILRRLKYLNILVPNLNDYFDVIIRSCLNDNTLYMFPQLMKYYYKKPLTYESIDTLVNFIVYYTNYEDISDTTKDIVLQIYYLLNTTTEKNIFIICVFFAIKNIFGLKIINANEEFPKLKDILVDKFNKLIQMTYNDFHINNINDIINSFNIIDISSCITIDSRNRYVFISLLPFIIGQIGPDCHKFNKIRYIISKYIKKVKQKTVIIKKLKMYPILNELKSLKPNQNIPILRNGTHFYQNKLQKFNTIPPYHLYPGQLQNFELCQDFLLKEKADGVLVNNIPSDIYPEYIFTQQVKAEYIEELDLYLVFDIDIPGTILERQQYIHKHHMFGQKKFPFINSQDELIDNINDERLKLKEFLDLPYDNYRWYPKPTWIISSMKNLIIPFTDMINMNGDIYKWICNEHSDGVKYDGIIITPLNGMREIKIKPKKHYTVDLLYKSKSFYDREHNKWDINIDIDNLVEGLIYRYYPYNNTCEIRYDKTKPNTYNVVNNIMKLYYVKYEYNYNNVYHNIKTTNKIWNDVIESNNNIMKEMINKTIKLKPSSNILDCGCGNARTLQYITNYNKYIGVDIDINMLGRAINKYNNTNIQFNYCDLNTDIDGWYSMDNEQFDIVFIISSLMHFSSDLFWNKIKKITKENSLMMVNILDMDNTKYTFDEYFIERNDSIITYKFPIHDSVKTEKYIKIEDIEKYGWKIIETFKPNTDNLTKLYTWYILIKI